MRSLRGLQEPEGQVDVLIQKAAEPILAAIIPQLRTLGGKNWRNIGTCLHMLREYATFGSQFRAQLFKLQIIEAMSEFILVTCPPCDRPTTNAYPHEYQPLLSLLSLLVRSTSLGTEPHRSPAAWQASEAEEALAGRTDVLPPQEAVLAALQDSNSFFYKLAALVTKAPGSPELEALTPLFCYAMSGNELVTHNLILNLMTALDTSTYMFLHGQLKMWQDFMLLEDGLRPLRLRLFHLNPREDKTIVGIFEMMHFSKTRDRAPKKTYFLLKFINWELSMLQDAQAFLMSADVLKHWDVFVSWLQKAINYLGCDDTPISNAAAEPHIVVRSPSAVGLLDELEVRGGEDICWGEEYFGFPSFFFFVPTQLFDLVCAHCCHSFCPPFFSGNSRRTFRRTTTWTRGKPCGTRGRLGMESVGE